MITLLLLLSIQTSFALRIKVAALAPKGTNWAKAIQGFAKEVKKKTKGRVKFKVFYGGVQGDEPVVLRKVRVGQLQGGIFTGKTLGDIAPNVRVMEVPFNFYTDRVKAKKALDGLTPYFNGELLKKEFVTLGFYEIGLVYVVSRKKLSGLNELKGKSFWYWEGDEVVSAMVSSLGLISKQVPIHEVKSALSTDMITAAYAPPMGILALQWQSEVKYLVNFPTAYAIAAFLVKKEIWNKVSAEDQKSIMEISKKYVAKANTDVIQDNIKGLEELKKGGVEFVDFSKEDIKKAETVRSDIVKKLKGEISVEAFKKLEAFR